MLCFKKFPVAKKFKDKRGGGGGGWDHDFPAKIFFSHSAEKVRRGTL